MIKNIFPTYLDYILDAIYQFQDRPRWLTPGCRLLARMQSTLSLHYSPPSVKTTVYATETPARARLCSFQLSFI